MPDGYGDGLPSWALSGGHRGPDPVRLMARHLRFDHGLSIVKIQQALGLSRAEVKRHIS